MGLLDEAIREHLELKRRSGADPGAIAREEREALAPVFPDEIAQEPAQGGHREPAPPPASADESSDPFAHAALGEETAELDMHEALAHEPAAGDVHPAAVGPVGAPGEEGLEPAVRAGDEPALGAFDEDIPDEEDGESPPPQLPGQERLGFE
jgi:hypothetical protein